MRASSKDKLTDAAVKIGTALGKAERRLNNIPKALDAAKNMAELTRRIAQLARELEKTSQRLKDALR